MIRYLVTIVLSGTCVSMNGMLIQLVGLAVDNFRREGNCVRGAKCMIKF